MSVTINPPKTPVTKGSQGVAAATTPNVCKMPGPPAPFVPTPLPNIGKSGDSPKGYSKSVKIEGKQVAIKGASFGSTGDMASKATGGGLVSANTHGVTKFVGPGSMNVKIEGKNVQFLSDPMFNNCGPNGSPPNSATLMGVIQASGMVTAVEAGQCPICEEDHGELEESPQTKTDAGVLAGNFEVQVAAAEAAGAAMQPPVKVRVNTMLGVVECACGKKYADQSAATTVELCKAASGAGMRHQSGVTVSYLDGRKALDMAYLAKLDQVKARIGQHLGHSAVFNEAWEEATDRAAVSNKNRSTPAAYPPGTCAAQGALLLLMDDGAICAAMTEQWFGQSKTQATIEYIDARSEIREVKAEKFKPGQTVPPCRSCELIVPLLICKIGKNTCDHKI